jgi:hypothetical protein
MLWSLVDLALNQGVLIQTTLILRNWSAVSKVRQYRYSQAKVLPAVLGATERRVGPSKRS